jgi:GNAT superfamily N-acetyltransferase
MKLPPGLTLTVENEVTRENREAVLRALGEFNDRFLGDPGAVSIGVFVHEAAGEMSAALIGYTYAGWLFVNLLWVAEDLRRSGIGRELMAAAEQRAIALGCHSAYLDTFSFQAPEFYPKLGYREFGRLDYPPNHYRVFFEKRLISE